VSLLSRAAVSRTAAKLKMIRIYRGCLTRARIDAITLTRGAWRTPMLHQANRKGKRQVMREVEALC